ncbi:hypothetical protein ACHAPJ_009610 [Fusarium lateritium]
MDGPTLPEPQIKVQNKRGVDFIIDTLRIEPPNTVSIMCLSSMTNLALALILAPDITPRIQEVVAMAGAYFEGGNITPTAEFNIYVDPEAATRVLASGIKTTLLPLDVKHQMLSTPARLKAMRDVGIKCAAALNEMMTFSETFDLKTYQWVLGSETGTVIGSAR